MTTRVRGKVPIQTLDDGLYDLERLVDVELTLGVHLEGANRVEAFKVVGK